MVNMMIFGNVSPLTLHFIRRLLLAITFWTLCSILFAYVSHLRAASLKNKLLLGRRELLENPLGEFSTVLMKKLNEAKQQLDEITFSPIMSESDIMKIVSQTSNLPLYYQNQSKSDVINYNKLKCSSPPSIYDLDFNNVYWQRLKIENTTFYLFNAYIDQREGVGKVPLVRVIGMIDKLKPPISYCKFWYKSKNVSINVKGAFVKVIYTYMWYNKWGNYENGILQPFLMSCPLLDSKHIPDSVSIVRKKCEKVTNNLRIINNKPAIREDFAVCVKGLDFLFEDISVRLVEWIEMLNILGAKKIFLYELEVHPNISKVLSYYVKQGLVELTPLTLPGKQPNLPGFRHLYLKSKLVNKRQNELIPYNDCLYRNLYSYKYLALLDTDEIIMPLKHKNWNDLMGEVLSLALKDKDSMRASFNFRNVYFLDDLQDGEEMRHIEHEEGIPGYLHMLQHVYRSKNYTKPGWFVKCFHNVDRVVSLHNHFPMNCFGQCTTYSVNTSLAHLQHYRKDCVDPLKNSCKEFRRFTERDTSIWRYKDQMIRKTTETLFNLNFFK